MLVLCAAAGYGALVGGSIAQAAAGKTPLDLSGWTGPILVVGAAAVAAAYLLALVGPTGPPVEASARDERP